MSDQENIVNNNSGVNSDEALSSSDAENVVSSKGEEGDQVSAAASGETDAALNSSEDDSSDEGSEGLGSAATEQGASEEGASEEGADNEALEEAPSNGLSSDKSEDEMYNEGLVDSRYKWYIVNTYAGSEDSARLNLLDRIARAGYQDFFKDIVVPKVASERVLKSGKKKKVEKTSFPGYLFVQMDLTEETMATVTGTPRVTGFVGNYRNPRPMSDKEVLRLLGRSVGEEEEPVVDTKVQFDKGESIKVIDGPFTNFDGLVEEVRADKMKLKVLVSIFGRETPVELSYSQVEKLS